MASPFENYPLYPYPSEFNVRDFVPNKLSESNYKEWKKLMLDFIKSRSLVRFIDGMVEASPPTPPKMVTVPVPNAAGGGGARSSSSSSSSSHCQIIENEEMYRSWKRSDSLVGGWILTTLTKDILTQVLPFKIAKEVQTELEAMFHVATKFLTFGTYMLACQPLQIAAIKGDWRSAMKFIEELPDAARVSITQLSEAALITVSSFVRNHFVKKLLEKKEPQDLAHRSVLGETALHIAAGVGNIEATKLLVEKNPKLSNVVGFRGKIALHFAAGNGHEEVVLYLLDAIKQDQPLQPFEDEKGAGLLSWLSVSGLYGK